MEAEIVLQDADDWGHGKRSVRVVGDQRDVFELIGLYQLARQATRDRMKTKDFRKQITASGP